MKALEKRAPASLEAFKLPRDANDLWVLFLSDKAAQTRKNYDVDLRCFARFAGVDTVAEAVEKLLSCSAAEANKAIFAYHSHLKAVEFYRPGDDPEKDKPVQVGYAPATINRRISALKAVLDLARTFRMVPWEIRLKLRRPSTVTPTAGPVPVGVRKINAAILAAIDEARETDDRRLLELALRDRVLFRFLFVLGLRRSEAIRIEWPGGVRLDGDEPDVLVLGKGRRRARWKPISAGCVQAIRQYLDVRKKRRGHLLLSTHPGHAGRGLNPSTVNRRITHWANVAEVPVTPHGFRHTGATMLMERHGGDLRRVAQWTRHENPEELRTYDDARDKHVRGLTEELATFLDADTD